MGSKQSKATSGNRNRRTSATKVAPSRSRQPRVFLHGCETDKEHKLRDRMIVEIIRPLKGQEGLAACGLEFRLVALREDGKMAEDPAKETKTAQLLQPTSNPSSAIENNDLCEYGNSNHDEEKKEEDPVDSYPSRLDQGLSPTKMNGKNCPIAPVCINMTRLFHKESNTMITLANRKEFIADGAMYDIVCRLAMEYSQDMMIRDGQMEWVTIPQHQVTNGNQSSTEPIRALVSSRLVKDKSKLDIEPTLLLVTGKGYVRAGIFSRQHLLTSGLECGCSVQFIREARKRNMNLIILDPNAHGDRFGMSTFEKSMTYLFRHWGEEGKNKVADLEKSSSTLEQKQQKLYVFSHSQSGAQLVRYLLDKGKYCLPYIGAIAFTDSTHNIQWAKLKNQEALQHLLESEMSVYLKRTDKTVDCIFKPFSTIGQVVDTDEFWKRRFGTIKTLCAGTSDHSLTNWFSRSYIWDHFDRFLAANTRNVKAVVHTNH